MSIIKKIIEQKKVKYWILEKILAQSLADLEEIKKLLSKNKVWVNTPDRIFKWSRKIKSFKKKVPISKCTVVGNNWGLICNSIHLLDFFSWWTGEKLINCNSKDLSKNWFISRRGKFIETSGKLYFQYSKGSSLTLKSSINENKPISLKYFLDDWTINKFSGYAKRKDGLILRGKIDLISDYMTIVIENILDNGRSQLPTLNSSYALHKVFLNEVINSWKQLGEKNNDNIPIT